MDVNRLNQGEKIAAVAAIVLLIDMFIFKWFGLSAEFETAVGSVGSEGSKNAWGSFDFIDWFLFLTVLAALGLAFVKARDERLELPVPLSVVVAVLGGLSTLFILFRLISPPDFGVDIEGVDQVRKIGAFIGLIAAAALTYGGWLAMQEEGTSFGDAADRFGGDDGPDVGGPGPGAGPDPGAGRAEPPSAPPPPPPPPPSGGQPRPPSA